MDPKRKKIYIVVIIVCLILSAGILMTTQLGLFQSEPVLTSPIITPSSTPNQSLGNAKTGYMAPAVFPVNDSFQTAVLESSDYQMLNPYTILDITGQLGRTDPFSSY